MLSVTSGLGMPHNLPSFLATKLVRISSTSGQQRGAPSVVQPHDLDQVEEHVALRPKKSGGSRCFFLGRLSCLVKNTTDGVLEIDIFVNEQVVNSIIFSKFSFAAPESPPRDDVFEKMDLILDSRRLLGQFFLVISLLPERGWTLCKSPSTGRY